MNPTNVRLVLYEGNIGISVFLILSGVLKQIVGEVQVTSDEGVTACGRLRRVLLLFLAGASGGVSIGTTSLSSTPQPKALKP